MAKLSDVTAHKIIQVLDAIVVKSTKYYTSKLSYASLPLAAGTRGWIRTNKSWSQSPLPCLLATRVYGPSGETQTLGLGIPNAAFYQLNYTRKYGTPYWTQTSDTRFRRPLLYSPELTRHTKIQQFSDMLRSW